MASVLGPAKDWMSDSRMEPNAIYDRTHGCDDNLGFLELDVMTRLGNESMLTARRPGSLFILQLHPASLVFGCLRRCHLHRDSISRGHRLRRSQNEERSIAELT